MWHPEKKDFPALPPDSQRLVFLSAEIFRAASHPERLFWEDKLEKRVLKLLEAKKQRRLDDAVEYLSRTDPDTCGVLLETAETLGESSIVQHDGERYDALLIMAPVLAWTRFAIPSGSLSPELHIGLTDALSKSVFSENVRFALLPELYSVDQLPQSPVETFSLMKKMVASLLDKPGTISLRREETIPFLSDVRYLIATVLVPSLTPLFRWQEAFKIGDQSVARQECLDDWKKKALPLLSKMMPGCALDLILPDAFFETARKAEQQIRPASVLAAINYLTQTLDIPATDLQAIIGGFAETTQQEPVTEYRIGFSLRDDPQIVYGVVWPIYGAEEAQQTLKWTLPSKASQKQKENQSPIMQILALLDASGIKCGKNHLERFPMEFCDECGAPLFADMNAELVHAELPDTTGKDTRLH